MCVFSKRIIFFGGWGDIFVGSPPKSSTIFRGLFEVNVQNGNNFWGMLISFYIFGEMPDIFYLFILFGGGGQML